MFKIDKDVKKQWLLFLLVNMVILLLVFGSLMAGYVVFVARADKKVISQSVLNYANELKSYSLDELDDACDGDIQDLKFNQPHSLFGIYTMRGDSSYEFKSNDDFLTLNNPSLGGKLDVMSEEFIGGHKFLTYTTSINGSSNGYIKVFSSIDFIDTATENIYKGSVPFIAGFVVLCAFVALVFGYIEIKPITDSYFKQKNFINDMSHEIRTPLAIIKGNLENVLITPDSKVSDISENITECIKEVDYMSHMSAGLLNIVRTENKQQKKDTILSDVVSEAVDMFADFSTLTNKSLVARIDYCPLVVDKEKVKQLLSILIENSLKYTNEGDRINVKLTSTTDNYILTVSDNGIGVNKNELESIFDRFYRGENAKHTQGTGLGLSIAKSIVEGMKGTIKAVSNIPSGLEIIVTFKV